MERDPYWDYAEEPIPMDEVIDKFHKKFSHEIVERLAETDSDRESIRALLGGGFTMHTEDHDAWQQNMLEFINRIDEKVQEPGNEKILASWSAGEFDECYEWIKRTYPELTEDQLTWIDEFLSEM